MKIVVLGVNGFVGSSLYHFLSDKKHDVEGWGRSNSREIPESDFKAFEIGSIQLSTLINSDVIINAMGAGVQSNLQIPVDELIQVNVQFPVRLIDFLSKNNFKGKLITLGSHFEIGEEQHAKEYTEDDIVLARHLVPNHYCATKRMFTNFVHSFRSKLNYIHLILPTLYGPGESAHRLLPYLIKSIKSNVKPQLSRGSQVRQYLYVGDFCLAIEGIINTFPGFPILNIPSGDTISIRELVISVYEYFQKPFDQQSFGKAEVRDDSMKYLLLDASRYKSIGLPVPQQTIVQVLPKY